MTKLIVIIGITGNQGHSIATRFLSSPTYRIRGITRNPSSPTALSLSNQGVEIVRADLDDVDSLASAFVGANLIFCVTNYWQAFDSAEARERASELGVSVRKCAGEIEERWGRNVVEAVVRGEGVLEGLDENGFIASTLSHAGKCSGGRFRELYHFDAKANIFPDYVRERYPALAKKMSCVQTGYFMSNHNLMMKSWFGKTSENTFQMSFSTDPDKVVPHFAVNEDMGNFVYAVAQLPPGRDYMAAGTFCSWKEYMRIWGEITGKSTSYKQVPVDDWVASSPDKELGREIADMFDYSSDPGYDGGDASILTAEDIRKAGVECPMTTLDEYIRKQDWTPVFSQ